MNDDSLLTYGSITIQALIVLVLVVLSVRSSKYRSRAIVVLGSLTPILYFYLSAWVAFVRDPIDPSVRFAFYAMWIMGFGFVLMCTLVGLLVAQLPKPTNFWLRYLLGVLVTLALFAAVSFVT